MNRLLTALLVAIFAALCLAPLARAGHTGESFGIASFDGSYTAEDGSPAVQAGSRPSEVSTSLSFDTFEDPETGEQISDGSVRDIHVDLPAGMAGDFTRLPRCTTAELASMLEDSTSNDRCPIDSQVGVLTVYFASDDPFPLILPIYNMVPPPGAPADFGTPVILLTVHLTPSVRTGGDYGITMSSRGTNHLLPLARADATIWGVPSDPSHDPDRVPCLGQGGAGCPVTFPPFPLLTMPTSCTGPLTTTMRANSWQHPEVFESASFLTHDEAGNPYGLHGCALLGFAPSLTARPTTSAADSPAGLDVDIHLPQNDNPDGNAAAHLKDIRVELPAGLAVNPPSAHNLVGCTPAQIDLNGPGADNCPNASKIGTVRVHTPLIDDPLEGAMFVAQPFQNPFNELIALYLAVDDPRTGVVVKFAGQVELDPVSGQITSTFEDNPQFALEDVEVSLFGGPRASLRTPAICGSYVTRANFTPWSSPHAPDHPAADVFQVTSGPGGGACSNPHDPGFAAGTEIPIAGSHSPFVLRVTRSDGEQRLRRIEATLPTGLAARFADVPYCPEAALAAAPQRPGKAEQAAPSCPAASRIGSVTSLAGAGPTPLRTEGDAYLSGPYKGAPLSVATIVPAVAGPFDLGTVVVRAAIHVDAQTAQGRIVSDPIPTILEGIPLDLRAVEVDLDRERFVLNPTSCAEKSIDAAITSELGAVATPSTRFQVGACAGLGFKPRMFLRLLGGTSRGAHPSLRTLLLPRPENPNIKRLALALPRSEFLDQGHIGTVCTRVQFAAEQCPPASVYGRARAFTPLLAEPLEGPVYLRSSANLLPDLVVALRGQVAIDAVGRIDSVRGGVRASFESIPDAPIEKVVVRMQGGNNGLFVNSRNLCGRPARALARFRAHNGRAKGLRPAMQNSCKKKGKRGKKRGGRR